MTINVKKIKNKSNSFFEFSLNGIEKSIKFRNILSKTFGKILLYVYEWILD
jgi:hypothetical protein